MDEEAEKGGMEVPARPVRFGPFRLDLQDQRLFEGDEVLDLPPKALAVLGVLIGRAGRLVTKGELLDAVWPTTYVSDGVLKVAIRELRRALRDRAQSPDWIQTVHRRGYRFIGDVEAVDEPVASAAPRTPEAPVTVEPFARGVIGRESILAALSDLLEKAHASERRTAFVTGAPGVGKTAVVECFADSIGPGNALVARGQCRESYGEGEAYQPILEALGELCRGDRREKVLPVLRKQAPSWLAQMPWLVEEAEREEIEVAAQGGRRERMLREIAEALEAIAKDRPLVLILEDLHWSDPSTLDAVSTLAQRPGPAKLLIVGTYRPIDAILSGHAVKKLKQDLVGRGRGVELDVELLGPTNVATYLRQTLGDEPPAELVDLVQRRTEGNALFLTTFVADLVDQGCVENAGGEVVLRRPLAEIEALLPDELKQILERHVDRLSPEGLRVLECASVVGREFTSAMVATTLGEDAAHVEEVLEELSRRDDFVRTTGVQRSASGALTGGYQFGHVLHQHALYDRLGMVRRAELHGRVADQLVDAGAGPAQLAYHFHAGGRIEEAIDSWERAGQLAMARWANVEAFRHLERALALLRESPDSPERDARELALLTAIGPPIGAVYGQGSPRVAEIYGRARELCDRTEVGPDVYPVLAGLFTFYVARARFLDARDVAEQLKTISDQIGDPLMHRSTYLLCGIVRVYLGELESAQKFLDAAIEEGEPTYQWGYSVDSLACAFSSQALLMAGDIERARERAARALDLARRVGDLYTESMVLHFGSVIHRWSGDLAATRDCITRVLAISEEQRLELWGSVVLWTSGWADAQDTDLEKGIEAMREAMRVYGETGTDTARTDYIGSQAAMCLVAGEIDEGLALVDEALEQVERSDERFFEAELHRVRGALLLAASETEEAPDPAAEKEVRLALEIAGRQGARTWELRAATTLCEMLGGRAKGVARKTLARVVAAFPDDVETPDLVRARALLA